MMSAKNVFSAVRVALPILFLWLILGANWTNLKKESFGIFHSQGGAGFGIVAFVLGLAMLIVALYLAAEKSFQIGCGKTGKSIGGNQLLLVLSTSSFITILSFLIISHSGSFRALGNVRGAGWGAAGAGLLAYFIPQILILGIQFSGASKSTPLKDLDRKKVGFGAFISSILIMLSPLFEWFSAGDETWNGYEPGAPRMGFIYLILGGVMALVGSMRLREKGLAEPGGSLSHPYFNFMASLVVLTSTIAWLITGFQRDDMAVGIGPWLALLAGIMLLGVALFEFGKREVTAV